MRAKLPMLLCFVGGVVMLLQFFVPLDAKDDFVETVYNSLIVVGVFALAVGLASLIHFHGTRIKRKLPGWGFSVITLSCAAIVAIIGITGRDWGFTFGRAVNADLAPNGTTNRIVIIDNTLFGYSPAVSNYVAGTELPGVPPGTPVQLQERPLLKWSYDYVLSPLMSTTFSLLAFYIVSAAYRAMRARTWEAALLLVAATIVLLGQIPIEQFVPVGTIDGMPTFEWLKRLIMDYPNLAAKRAILIGVALGIIATAIKIIIGIEKPYLGGRG